MIARISLTSPPEALTGQGKGVIDGTLGGSVSVLNVASVGIAEGKIVCSMPREGARVTTVFGNGDNSGRSLLTSRSQEPLFPPTVLQIGLAISAEGIGVALRRTSRAKTTRIPTRLTERMLKMSFWRLLIVQEKFSKKRGQPSDAIYLL
jgi:hypothetical protein